jgi:hypothetical protein
MAARDPTVDRRIAVSIRYSDEATTHISCFGEAGSATLHLQRECVSRKRSL